MTLMLAGCPTVTTETTTSPTCAALGANADNTGPIKYSSRNPKSLRYAGPKLAPDLATRNQVGRHLGCWQ